MPLVLAIFALLLSVPTFTVMYAAVLTVPLQALLAVLAVLIGARRVGRLPDGKERRLARAGLIVGGVALAANTFAVYFFFFL